MDTRAVFLGVLGLVALVRLAEVIVSRARLRARPEALVAEPALFPLMVLLHVGLIALPALEVLGLERPFRPALCAAAAAVLVAATALRVWTLRTIGRAWNVRVVVPDPDAVVTSGPYAWIRHPNYLVVILEIASLPLLHGAWISALSLSLLNACVLSRRIRTEEAALSQLPAWREAMADRKRLIPGLL
ncbi:MAG: isoprenylcysteine carboxylmethyltransferase family protein [Planctomycetota bacterium]